MQHSSKYNPCPVCGRYTDDKCRWNDSTILCYCGDLFHPPQELKLGQILKLGHDNWKLISYYAGFSNGSYLFAKTDAAELLSPLQQQRQKIEVRAGAREKIIGYKNGFARARKMLHQCLAIRDLQHLKPEEIKAARRAYERAIEQCSTVLAFVASSRTQMTIKKNHVFALRYWSKMLDYELKDLINFENTCLGVLINPPAEPPAKEQGDDWF